MTEILLATGNLGKIQEIEFLLKPCHISTVSQATLNIKDADETGSTYVENALSKAYHAAKFTHLPVIADDSGLEVDYLEGAPGIYSARFAGSHATAKDNIKKLLHLMEGVTQRKARFCCVMVYCKNAKDTMPLIRYGIWEGMILNAPQGAEGFGYDPIFYVPDYQCSAAELDVSLKNRISHRGQALTQIISALQWSCLP
jgi:XTP/dITP diphosphohydrolase